MESLLNALKAAAEPTRLRLLCILAPGELTVSELTRILGQSQPRVSRHLKLLCESGLLERHQEGSWVFYRLADTGHGATLARYLVAQVPGDDPMVAVDRERLGEVRRNLVEAASAYFERVAETWDEVRTLFVDDDTVEAAMVDALDAEPVACHVDLGTGTGRMLRLFAPRVGRAIGFDLSHEMLAVARAHLGGEALGHCQVRKGDIYNLALPPASADLVTIHHVLHYLDDPGDAVREAARILRPGGQLLVVDFAPHAVETLRAEHAHRRLGFADDEVRSWFEAAGLLPHAIDHFAPSTRSDAGERITVTLWAGRKAGSASPYQLEVA